MRIRSRQNVRLNVESLEERDVPSSSLSGLVFADANNNGVAVPGEAALAGVSVTLIGLTSQNHSVNVSQRTDVNGMFEFTGLAAGVYSIQETPASHFINGLTSAGSQGGSASIGSITNITLADGVTGAGNELGELAQSSGWTSIQGNFNGTAIPAGDTLWFSSVFKANGLGSSAVTLQFTGQTISYVVNGSTVTISVPDSMVTLSPTATTASTTFDSGSNSWVTSVPSNLGGNFLLGGVALPLPAGLPSGIKNVNWQGQMTSSVPGVSVNWQWAAATYSNFSTDYNALDIKPVDDNKASQYQNSDHAGTPEAFGKYVVGGATGGGGSNFTGSYSSTASVQPPVQQQEQQPASVSGYAINQFTGAGIGGIKIELEDSSGNVISTTMTASDGSYSFTNLQPGTYQLMAVQTGIWLGVGEQVGQVNGNSDGSDLGSLTLGSIVLANGNAGINYDFLFGSRG